MRWSATAWIEPHAVSRPTGRPGGSSAARARGATFRLAADGAERESETAPSGRDGPPERGRERLAGRGLDRNSWAGDRGSRSSEPRHGAGLFENRRKTG